MKLDTIRAVLQDLLENCEELAKDKFSGVHYVSGIYRIHESSFIPRAFAGGLNDDITTVVDMCFSTTMEWDKRALWLTIKKEN